MEKSKSVWRRALPYFAVVASLVFLAGFLFLILPRQPRVLYPAEVRNYQGENLSSVSDVLENAIKGLQNINASTYHLNVTGLVQDPLYLTYDDVVGGNPGYLKVVTIYCVEGWHAKILWEGVLVKDLLLKAGANMSASTVIFRASDGYSTSLPLSYIVDNNILLASKMNNITLPPERGFPFELVAESQYGYKWIKWLTEIEVSDDSSFLGYWETRGLANNATVTNP